MRQLCYYGRSNSDLVDLAHSAGIETSRQSAARLAALAETEDNQGVVAVCAQQRQSSWQQAVSHAQLPLVLVLDQIQDPRNLGACIRTAAAMGVHAVVHPRRRSAGLTPAASKVAAGGEEHVAIEAVSNLARSLKEMRDSGLLVVGTVADDAQAADLDDLDLSAPLALVLGGEHKGIRSLTRRSCDELATISLPKVDAIASLNVSVACGICLHAVNRSRRMAAAGRNG